jgi:four helix bundle protein
VHSYPKLKVWQRSVALCREIYGLTEPFPRGERFGLTNQMRRAAVSIPSNIAEGSAFRSEKEVRRYLRMALGSAYELDTQLVISAEVGYIPSDTFENVRSELLEVRAMIVGLYRSVPSQQF